MSEDFERKGLADPFKGITTNGDIVPGLFPIARTGVSTEPVRNAAEKFISSLNRPTRPNHVPGRRHQVAQVDEPAFLRAPGNQLQEMTDPQRAAAFGLMHASLSARGFELTRNIMRLNETLAELIGEHTFLGEWLYFITVMGSPSATEPWGWQLDGHHCIVNYFVLGDQVVMTPHFIGSEPVRDFGQVQRSVILQDEQNQGFAFLQSLADAQRKQAILNFSKTGNNNLTEAFKDNVVLDYAGLRVNDLANPRAIICWTWPIVRQQYGLRSCSREDGGSRAAHRGDLVRLDRRHRAG